MDHVKPSSPTTGTTAKGDASHKIAGDPLIAAICHDLRAPLAAVTMGANFVLQTTRDDEANARTRRILEAMLRSCTQMERLVRNFSDLAEIEGRSLALRLAAHDASQIAQMAAHAVEEVAKSRAVVVNVEAPASPIVLSCDRDRILHALDQLLHNAIRSSPSNGTVTLAVSDEGGSVAFHVIDRGSGLGDDVKQHLFEREWHAKRQRRVAAGFGLSIARGFAEAHGGRLVAESRPNVETRFTLSIPKRNV